MGLVVPVTSQQDTIVQTGREVRETLAVPPGHKAGVSLPPDTEAQKGTVTFPGGIPT